MSSTLASLPGHTSLPRPNHGTRYQIPVTAGPTKPSRPEVRAQSIIPPWEFYGLENSHPPPNNLVEPTPPLSSPSKETGITEPANYRKMDFILDLEDTPPRSSPPIGFVATTRTNRKTRGRVSDSISDSRDDGSDHNGQGSSPSLSFRLSPLQEVTRNTDSRRHQSLPIRTRRHESHADNTEFEEAPQNPKDLVSLVEEIVRKRLADHATTAAEMRAPEPPPPKKRKMSTAQRKLRDPPVSKDIRMVERKSDAELLLVAKYINPYDRHRQAPYAFRYNGRLYAEYKRLRIAVGNNGRAMLTAEELSRL